MVIVTEEIDLPTAQPKSFQVPLVSPSNDLPVPASANKARSPLSLRLRRVTPDRFRNSSVTTPNSDYKRGSSVHSASTSTPRAKSPGGIERVQKLQDEFYDGPQEELEDGELPSLSRTPSNPRSRGVSQSPRPAVVGYWSQDVPNDEHGDNHADDIAASISAKNMSNTALADSARKRMASSAASPMDEREFERVKVAGFWSQLDEVSDGSIEDGEVGSRLPAVHYEDEPDDERDWRRGQSPEVGNAHSVVKFQRSTDTEEEETWKEEETNTKTYPESTNVKGSNWNLIEKAACFANERDAATVDNHSDGSHQSLDRTYQTSASHTAGATYDTRTRESGTYNQTVPREGEEDKGMFDCLTDALGTICGYSTYVGDAGVEVAPSDEEKKARALAIMEGQRTEEGYTDDEESKMSKNINEIGTFDSEYEEDEKEVPAMSESGDAAAIELEYLSRDDKEEAEDQMSTRDNMASNTVVAGVAAMGAGALVATTVTSKSPQEEEAPTEVPKSPVSEAKKKRLTVKAVKNLLGLRKKKESVNEDTPNLAAVMTSSAKGAPESELATSSSGAAALGAVAVGAAVTSSKDDVDDDMPEMEDADDDSIFTDDDEDEPQDNPTQEESTLGGLNSYNNQDEHITRETHPNVSRKNRSIFDEEELESQAAGWDSNRKNSYLRDLAQRAKQEYHQKKSLDHSDPDLTTGVTASMGAAVLGSAAVGGAMLLNQDNEDEEGSKTEQNEDASHNESTAESKGSYNVDYNSFSPLEKRKFLRLLNSGMSPQEATRMIVDEREESIPVLEEADDQGEEDDDSDCESEEDDAEKSAYSYDPPGSVLEGESGESAEPSVREVEETQEISRSEKATAGGTSRDATPVAAGISGTAAVAVLAVPAIVRAKSKKSLGQHGDHNDKEGEEQEEVYQRGADGLVSVGDKYYDSLQASYEQEDVDITLLLDRENSKKSKKISKKPSVSGFTKVTSRRSIVSPRSSSSKFTSVNEGSVAQQHFSRPNSTSSVNRYADEPVDDVISPRSEASISKAPKKFNFNIHRGSRWAKVGSNLDSDVTEVPTVEDDQKEFYEPESARVHIEDTRSPISIPDDETPGSRQTHGQSVAAATSNRSDAVESSTKVSHVALPSLLPTDARGRNVVTPTNEIEENEEDDVFSPAQSVGETASRANSLFMSPDTLSPTSPQDFGSITGTPRSEQQQQRQESRGIDKSSHFQPVYSPSDAQFATNSSTSQLALIPDSPPESFSPNEIDGNSITNYSLAEQSFITLGTAWTAASKSSRRRHRGAAGKRLMEAKEAQSQAGPKAKGWMGSIQDVAAKRDQLWDPERGWQDYTEPERASNFGETKPIGSLHLNKQIAHRKQEPSHEYRAFYQEEKDNLHVDFPREWATERKNMIGIVQPQVLAAVENSAKNDEYIPADDKSAITNDVSITSTSAETASLLHDDHASMRRTKPSQKASADTRKTSIADTQVKSAGWKESMEVATAEISDENRQWNYEEGWVENKDLADDVSELTKMSLERSPRSQLQRSPVEVMSPISPTHFLPSVAEGIAESESQAEEEASSEDRAIQTLTNVNDDAIHRESDENSLGSEYESEEEEFDVDQMMLQDNPVGDSDKENDLSNVESDDDSEDSSPKLVTEEFPLVESNSARSLHHDKPPLPKRSLNQWLERSLKDSVRKPPDAESENAVNSRETNGDSLDDIQVDEGTTKEINVVRERCDDNDKDLFQNDVSDIQLDSSNSRDLVIESFESANSSENDWINSLSPIEQEDDNNVSSRALAWMSSMEKKSSTSMHPASKSESISTAADPYRKKSDPPQNLDPPSVVSDRVTTKRIQSRYGSGTLSSSNATPTTSNQQNVPPKSRVGELISSFESPSKPTQSSQNGMEEHDVIFHSNAMGIRLKRGEDGLVRVVSVTESSPGSSISREGLIEPGDILREAAGADLRSPISNSHWGEVVQIIRNASRPMKFVVSSSKKLEDVASSLQSRGIPVTRVNQDIQKPPQILFGGSDSVGSSHDDDSTAKESLFQRISKCAVPEKSEKSINGERGDVPMAHLAFLRTNPTIAKVRNEASRRYPALCGRPDTIFEEPEDTDAVQGRHLSQRPLSMDRSFDTSYDGSAAPTSVTGPARTGTSVGAISPASSGSDNNVAYLDRLAPKSAVSNKQTRTWNNTQQHSLGRTSPTGSNEVGWPDCEPKGAELLTESNIVTVMEMHEIEECEI